MYAREISSESVYTLREAQKIIKAEHSRKREVFLNKAKQKLLGILAIGVSIAELAFAEEGGLFIFMLPLGLYLLFSKKEDI